MGDARSDRELLDGCLAGDRGAWEDFVARFQRLVWWSIGKTFSGTSYASRQDLKEDVFQDVFARLLEKGELASLRDSSSVRKFLAVTASRRALDRMKSLGRAERRFETPDPEGESPLESAASEAAGPRESAQAAERRRLVARAMEDLPERERRCLELHYAEGKTHREIAEALGIPQDTVSTVIRRTKEKLRSLFEEKGLDA